MEQNKYPVPFSEGVFAVKLRLQILTAFLVSHSEVLLTISSTFLGKYFKQIVKFVYGSSKIQESQDSQVLLSQENIDTFKTFG